MSMCIHLYEKRGDSFISSSLWEDEKYVGNDKFDRLVVDNGIVIDKTQPFSEIEQYWRPKDSEAFKKCRDELRKFKYNQEVFGELLDLLENNSNLYLSFY
jgi:hypothetical protein